MKGLWPTACQNCRTQIIIEGKEDIIDKVVDGRRWISAICPSCGEEVVLKAWLVGKWKDKAIIKNLMEKGVLKELK